MSMYVQLECGAEAVTAMHECRSKDESKVDLYIPQGCVEGALRDWRNPYHVKLPKRRGVPYVASITPYPSAATCPFARSGSENLVVDFCTV